MKVLTTHLMSHWEDQPLNVLVTPRADLFHILFAPTGSPPSKVYGNIRAVASRAAERFWTLTGSSVYLYTPPLPFAGGFGVLLRWGTVTRCTCPAVAFPRPHAQLTCKVNDGSIFTSVPWTSVWTPGHIFVHEVTQTWENESCIFVKLNVWINVSPHW